MFHVECLDKWTQTGAMTCPICSARVSCAQDPIATKLKKNARKYAGFQLWCIQKRVGIRLIRNTERNQYFCFKAAKSLSLKDELAVVEKMTPNVAFDTLMTLCQHHPTVISDNA